MQRSITYQTNIKHLFIFVFLLMYLSISSNMLMLPPLFGVAFIYFIKNFENRFVLFFIFIYLLFFEALDDFILFSSMLFFYISYYLIYKNLSNIVVCYKCLIPILVAWSYIGFFIFSNILSYILNIDLFEFQLITIYFILIESLLAIILF
ncbi:MAG: hypothetical protein HXX81_03410 [Campylobacterales bacterium]|nr:hypothetical protein [Campylobacterales bacterium]